MIEEGLELSGGIRIEEDIEKKAKTVGVKGLDWDKAKELGVWQRISYLFCAVHSSIMAAYKIYGDIDVLMSELGVRRNSIAKAMNDFDVAYERFVKFWSDYYSDKAVHKEIHEEIDNMYHKVMHWAQLPETWQLGDSQRIPSKQATIRINTEDEKVINLFTSVLNSETIGEPCESWCVTKFNTKDKKQETVNTNMDKASAMMVAKRLSADDKENIYTASLIREVTEKRTEVVPFKAYMSNETVGKITKLLD